MSNTDKDVVLPPLEGVPVAIGDLHWMRRALRQAEQAAAAGEVPVGAVVVVGDRLLAACGNAKEAGDPTAHAEVNAIRAAAAQAGDWRLSEATLYSTLEPCLMCYGAILQARVKRVVYGASDPKFGALGSVVDARALPWNHRPQVCGGVLATEAAAIMRTFFQQRRASASAPA